MKEEALEYFNVLWKQADGVSEKYDKFIRAAIRSAPDDHIRDATNMVQGTNEYMVCCGCGRVGSELPPPPAISCCPERKLVPVQDLINQLWAKAYPNENQHVVPTRDPKELENLRNIVRDQQEYGSRKPQRIVCAACRWPDGHIILGIRHFSPDMRLSAALQGYDYIAGIEQGFVDQFGVFLTRQDAFKVALSQGQYRPYEPYNIGTLYSEDLY